MQGAWRRVVSITPLEGQETVYNFTVAKDHDYFVGETGFLVHNEEGCNCLFRGDDELPEKVFEEGFKPWGTSDNLLAHALDNRNPPSMWVPTSTSAEEAAEFGQYVYAIENPGTGVDVNAALGRLSPHPWEQEIAIPGRIPPSRIRGVTLPCGTKSLLNPNFEP
jgi:hypothetical protein